MNLEELKEEANQLSIEDLRELAEFCNGLADSIEEKEKGLKMKNNIKKYWAGLKAVLMTICLSMCFLVGCQVGFIAGVCTCLAVKWWQ